LRIKLKRSLRASKIKRRKKGKRPIKIVKMESKKRRNKIHIVKLKVK